MRRLSIGVLGLAVLSGSLLAAAPGHATTPPVAALTENQYVEQVANAGDAFATGMNGKAVLIRNSNGQSVDEFTVNPDASYIYVTKEKSQKSTTMCLPPKESDAYFKCWKQAKSGKWYPTEGFQVEATTSAGITAQVIQSTLRQTQNVVADAAQESDAEPVYTVTSSEKATTFTATVDVPGSSVRQSTTFTSSQYTQKQEVDGQDTVTTVITKTQPVRVFRPTGSYLDRGAIVQGDMNAIAKSLETWYTDNAVYPNKKIAVESIEKSNTYRVCYNRKTDPMYYTIMGSYNGGKTYWVYKADDGGMQSSVPVRSKSSKLPSCRSLRTNSVYDPIRPMVPGPRVVAE